VVLSRVRSGPLDFTALQEEAVRNPLHLVTGGLNVFDRRSNRLLQRVRLSVKIDGENPVASSRCAVVTTQSALRRLTFAPNTDVARCGT
jgi:hypothetical protein